MNSAPVSETQPRTYQENPFIERLPPILSKEEFEARTILLPDSDGDPRGIPYEIRMHLVATAHDLFIPLPRHYQLYMCIDRMIRRGYINRNPLKQAFYWKEIREQVDALSVDLAAYPRLQRCDLGQASELTQALIGLSGSGKTWGAEAVLSYFPQRIVHGEFKGIRLNIIQVPWLWIQAPSKSSTNELCNEFFRGLDHVLGTDYFEAYGNRVLREMLDQMARLCGVHAIGLLVIDEIQEVENIKSGGHEALIGFFLKLTNRVRIPILMIGTYKAKSVLFNQLRLARRSCGAGLPEWSILTKTEWAVISRAMWKYQYTQTSVPWSQELSDALFEESQGIADIAVKLFILAQQRVILQRGSQEKERISAKLFESAAKKELGPLKPILDALRKRDYQALVRLDDVKLPSIQEMLAVKDSDQGLAAATVPSADSAGPEPSKHQNDAARNGNEVSDSKATGPKIRILRPVLTEIAKQVHKGLNSREPVKIHEALRLAGWIKPANEFWNESQT